MARFKWKAVLLCSDPDDVFEVAAQHPSRSINKIMFDDHLM